MRNFEKKNMYFFVSNVGYNLRLFEMRS